jgi:hypothetical protein
MGLVQLDKHEKVSVAYSVRPISELYVILEVFLWNTVNIK